MTDQTSTISTDAKALADRPKGWKMTTLGEVVEVKGGKRLPLGTALQQQKNSHPYLRITDIVDNVIQKDKLLYVPDSVFPSIKRYIVSDGDIILSIVGTIGSVSRIDSELHNASLTENCVKLTNFRLIDNIYLFHYLISREGQAEILGKNVGSTQPKLPIYNIEKINILLPPLPEQTAISAVLGSLDNKIELLREQNKTLESIAQAIFKEWFMNFNFPGSTGIMIDSEMGKIPIGWRVGTLGDVICLEYGKPLKEEVRSGKGYPVLGSNGIVGYHKDYLIKGGGIVVGRKGTMGSVVWIDENFYPIDTTFYVQDRLGVGKLYFHYLLLLIQNFQKIGSDSAVPGLNRNAAYSIETVVPTTEIVNRFHEVIEPIFSKLKLNRAQIQTLSKLRSTLLPRLMKGEVRVKGFSN